MKEIIPVIPFILGVTSLIIAITARIISKFNISKEKECSEHLSSKLNSISSLSLSAKETREALRKLENYTKALQPDNIIGINRGGVMISALISLRQHIDTDHFARCLVSPTGKRVECDNSILEGKVLIIDDIVRSGSTMKTAVDYFRNNFKEISEIYTACLVVTVDQSHQPTFKDLTFWVYRTMNDKFLLPWTPRQKKKREKIHSRKYFFENVKTASLEKLAKEVDIKLDANGLTNSTCSTSDNKTIRCH